MADKAALIYNITELHQNADGLQTSPDKEILLKKVKKKFVILIDINMPQTKKINVYACIIPHYTFFNYTTQILPT